MGMRQWITGWGLLLVTWLVMGCSASRQAFNPQRKFTTETLQKDYRLFRQILEESHPSLYWFTPKDSMDHYFSQGYARITDSMTEPQFRNLLTWVTAKIRCGHTTVKYSKKYNRYLDTLRQPIFPLSVKVWPDSMVVVANLNRKDSILKRGTIVTAINGDASTKLVDTLAGYISSDGHSGTARYQTLSNRGTFGSMYRNVFGLPKQFTIRYLDLLGEEKETIVPVYEPPKPDTPAKQPTGPARKPPPREEPRAIVLRGSRNIQIDTTLRSAYMTVNTFSQGQGLKRFFRRSFRMLHRWNIKNLVVDVRANGGGDATNSTLLTRFLVDKKFKLADSLYAKRRSSSYSKYIRLQPLYWFFMQFITHKERDGLYHFGYFERHYFKPKKKNHFNGDVYLVTGGNSFSATTLFVKALKGQKNVKIIGEETGGGAYGNSAWMIPDVTLPNTKIRFRLPKFRLVMDSHLVKEGRGIMPDITVMPTRESILRGIDPKVDTVRKIILQKTALVQQ